MTRYPFLASVVLLSLLALPLSAQSTDDLNFLLPNPAPKAGEAYTLGVRVGPARPNVEVIVDWTLPVATLQWIDPRCTLREGRTYRCNLGVMTGGTFETLRAGLVAPPSGSFYESTAIFVSPAPLTPFPKHTELTVRTPSRIVASIVLPDESEWADGRASVRFDFETLVPPERLDLLRIDISVPHVEGFTAPAGWSCQSSTSTISCEPPAFTKESITVEVSRTVGDVNLHAGILWRDRNYPDETSGASVRLELYDRELLVTNTADAGPGSLRQAILDAATCAGTARCRIGFALPDAPDGGWSTVRVLSPLPPLRGSNVTIDATTQTRRRDTNPRGPEVALDGDALTSGNGIVVETPSHGGVRGLAIHSFPGNAVECHANCSVRDSYLGMDADGVTMRPNASRGVAVLAGAATIEDNVISGNSRSGIFVMGAGGSASRNLIGVAADGVTPVGNAASGVFIGAQPVFPSVSFVLTGNVIAYSSHFGVAIAEPQSRVAVFGNRFIANRISDVDVGLNGRNAPGVHLVSAVYDPASDSTFIRGTVDVPGRQTVSFYSEGAYHGALAIDGQQTFVFRAAGDLTGRSLTASLLVHGGFPELPTFVSTELSDPLRVQ